MMKPEKIIEGLKFTVAMCEYDPLTRDIIERCFMNDMTRTTYDACNAAIEFIEKHQYVHDKCKKCIEFSEFKEQPNSDDSISKSDLIAVMHLIMDDAKIGDNDEDYESLDDIKEQYIEIVKGMVSVKPEIKWIPVSEKLPNRGDTVIATFKSPVTGMPFVATTHIVREPKEVVKDSNIIAWMPIMKPYKEK